MALDPITTILDIGGKVIDRLWPDPTQRDAAKLELMKMQQSGELAQLAADTDLAKAQIAVNQAEATNSNVFVSGWRPWIGWICGFSYAYHFIFEPFLTFSFVCFFGHPPLLPSLDIGELGLVMATMLGMSGMRSWEKKKGIN